MLDDEEKKDLLAGAVSDSARLDFEIMRRNAAPREAGRMDIDELIDFLEAALRLSRPPSGPRAPQADYPRPLI